MSQCLPLQRTCFVRLPIFSLLFDFHRVASLIFPVSQSINQSVSQSYARRRVDKETVIKPCHAKHGYSVQVCLIFPCLLDSRCPHPFAGFRHPGGTIPVLVLRLRKNPLQPQTPPAQIPICGRSVVATTPRSGTLNTPVWSP